eukprot:g3463.t1
MLREIHIVTAVQEQKPRNFAHFLQLVKEAVVAGGLGGGGFVTFRFLASGVDETSARGDSAIYRDLVLEGECVRDFEATKALMMKHRIPAPASEGEVERYREIIQGGAGGGGMRRAGAAVAMNGGPSGAPDGMGGSFVEKADGNEEDGDEQEPSDGTGGGPTQPGCYITRNAASWS